MVIVCPALFELECHCGSGQMRGLWASDLYYIHATVGVDCICRALTGWFAGCVWQEMHQLCLSSCWGRIGVQACQKLTG